MSGHRNVSRREVSDEFSFGAQEGGSRVKKMVAYNVLVDLLWMLATGQCMAIAAAGKPTCVRQHISGPSHTFTCSFGHGGAIAFPGYHPYPKPHTKYHA